MSFCGCYFLGFREFYNAREWICTRIFVNCHENPSGHTLYSVMLWKFVLIIRMKCSCNPVKEAKKVEKHEKGSADMEMYSALSDGYEGIFHRMGSSKSKILHMLKQYEEMEDRLDVEGKKRTCGILLVCATRIEHDFTCILFRETNGEDGEDVDILYTELKDPKASCRF